jgi:hypothetical protein
MAGVKKAKTRKAAERRRPLTEGEVKKVVEQGKISTFDRRAWGDRRKKS